MRHSTFFALCVGVVLASSACTPSDSAPGMAVRDSAGVRVVEYAGAPEPAASLRLSAEPLFRVGHGPTDHLFARVQMGALRPNGGAVVVDIGTQPGAAHEVLDLAPDGSIRAVLARGGQGPEEVLGVQSITVFEGDSVLVWDRGNGKFMVFADTELVRSVGLASAPELARGLGVLGVDDAGRPLMRTAAYSTAFTEPWLAGHLARADLATLRADTVATFDMAPRIDRTAPRYPFAPFGIATATGGGFAHIRNDVPELVWRAADGSVRQILRWEHPFERPTAEHIDRYTDALRDDLVRVNPAMEEDRLQEFVAEQVANLHVPPDAVLPITLTLHGDDEGRVWMSAFVPVGGIGFHPPHYTVVDADGTWLGTVEMPERFRLLDIAGRRVLGVQLDALEVESVVVYELIVEPR